MLPLLLISVVSPVVFGSTGMQEVQQDTITDELANHFCKIDKDLSVTPSCNVTFAEINHINKNIRNDLVSLVHTDFFRYFRLDLYKPCTIWENNDGLCFSRECTVDVVEDWENLPEIWQPEVLGKLDNSTEDPEILQKDDENSFLDDLCMGTTKKGPLVRDFDYNYCDVNDLNNERAVLVDLTANPERFTGYGGQQSSQIWTSIYRDNCFPLASYSDDEESALAKDAFFRLVSGLHASIGTHLSNDYLNTTTGKWEPSLDLFMFRVGNFPERVTNMYFNYAVVAKSLWKIKPYLNHLGFCNDYNEDVKSKIINIVSQLDSSIFNEDLLFANDLSDNLKNEFRSRFKNVTRIMDCVHCDRCKLWGKVQTTGMATSLKILFDFDENDEESKQHFVDKLTKFELIALFNTFDKLSESIAYVNNFESLYMKRLKGPSSLYALFQNNNFFKLLGKATKSLSDTVQNINGSINGSNATSGETLSSPDKKVAEPRFQDLKVPKKSQSDVSKQESKIGIWQRAWKTETHNFKVAVKFILRSYWDLPKNLWDLALVTVSKVWNGFVGVSDHMSQDVEPNVYELDIQ